MIFTRSLQYLCLYTILLAATLQVASAQISPPGLGEAKTASWMAIGVRQDLNSKKDWQSMTYIGLGRKSNPNNDNPAYKPSIVVLNQEFYHPFAKSWQTSFAISYRRQHEYQGQAPFAASSPSIQQEFRLYGRLSKSFTLRGISLSPTIRQELRRFYTPEFKDSSQPLQLRSRFRIQASTHLDPDKKHKVMLSSEQLFNSSKTASGGSWSTFAYAESRFMAYYSYSPSTLPITLDIGYMNNLIGKKAPSMVHYIAFDIIVKNPFGQNK